MSDGPPWDAALPWPLQITYLYGDLVAKKGRSKWRGRVCGWYRSSLTDIGYAVESAFEPGSVQIYPETALEKWDGTDGE